MGQRDMVVELVLSQRCGLVGKAHLGFQLSDHCMISSLPKGARRKVLDFHKTYEAHGDSLGNYFSNLCWVTLLINSTADALGDIFNKVVTQGWKKLGIFKHIINSDSKPWSDQLSRGSSGKPDTGSGSW